MFINECLDIRNGHLNIGGVDAIDLAAEFGTPIYVMDEQTIRKNCHVYTEAVKKYAPNGGMVLFASKALSFKGIYKIVMEENLGSDIVSSGELYTALSAGFPLERAYFHGNNKTYNDIKFGIDNKIGCFVVDNMEELGAINQIAAKKQKILLRITPGIDAHTHRAMITGNVDSKFGTPIQTGQALEIVKYALSLPNVELAGLHCHIGSQILEYEPFILAADIMTRFIAEIKEVTGYELCELNLGGGYGVRYIEEHTGIDFDTCIKNICETVVKNCKENNLTVPYLIFEPGRSIVANAGITLYTIGSVKNITGFKNYVSVDGGMPDNPRYALYGSVYEAEVCDRADEPKNFECTLAGRCCESGDFIAENIKIQSCWCGDILAVLTTGAYNYSMASNYNRIPRPPIIMIKDGKPYIAVKRESFEDLIKNDN